MGNSYHFLDGSFQFNDGAFLFWAVFKVLDRSKTPMPARYLGSVRCKGPVKEAIEKRFPGMDFEVRVAWKSQVNKWRKRYPHKTLYKAPYPLNRAMCKKCGEVVESMHRHDYVACSCGAMAVDGGYDYMARTGYMKMIEEMP